MILCHQFHTYSHILLVTVNPTLSQGLQVGVAIYQERLMGYLIKCLFESVRLFHFALHRVCIIHGIDHPETWSNVDVSLESQFLRYGNMLASSVSSASTSQWKPTVSLYRPRDDGGEKIKDKSCLKWNCGKGRFNCRYRHQCCDCGGSHTVTQCVSNGNLNQTPVSKRL